MSDPLSEKERALIEAARPIVAAKPDPIARRIALLMESERQEKAQRLKQHRRWKIGAVGVFVVLAGWSALTLIGYLRH